jgi:hypothetical protein
MLGLTILLWAEAGLALVPGDRVMACRSMMAHDHAGTMEAAEDASADVQAPDAMPCCPLDEQAPVLSVNHPQCCSVSNDAERPVAFLVSSDRTTTHPVDVAIHDVVGDVPPLAHYHGELSNADASRFVKPILELKTDLRI